MKHFQIVFVISLSEFLFVNSDGKAKLPTGLSRELYCAGCEETVKVLDDILKPRTSDTYDLRVLEALSMICDKKSFLFSQYVPYYMSQACSHLIESHEDVLEPFLVSHYSRKTRNSFSELTQQICKGISSACDKISRSKMEKLKRKDVEIDEDGSVKLTEGDWKMPKPTTESRDEF